MEQPSVAIIGAGALGTVLARRLSESGYSVRIVLSRSEDEARRLADRVGAPLSSADLAALPADVPLVVCCVPDDAIAEVAHRLATVQSDWSGRTVAHTSGALTSSILAPLKEQGASVFSFHPLQTFHRGSPPRVFEGIYVGLEGDAEAVAVGVQLARDLGALHVTLGADAKMRYHLAAVMASNYFVTLMALVGEVLADVGLRRQEGLALIRPLVGRTWTNLERHLPEDVLTGPVVRGDRATVQGHLDALADHLPHLLPAYAVLGAETARIAVQGGKLTPEAAQDVLDAIHAAIEPHDDVLP